MRSQGLTLEAAVPFMRQGHAAAFARVEVRRTADAVVRQAWGDLERVAPCSVYQTRAWLLPWLDTLGRAASVAPAFALAWSDDGRPVALLCLGVVRRGPFKVAVFLGGKDSNFAMGLMRPGVTWTKADLSRLLVEAARAFGGDAPDVYALTNQPLRWAGVSNPLAALAHQPAPSAAYGAQLMPKAEDFFAAHLSKDSRKKLRKKEARLADYGPVTYCVARSATERTAVLDQFLLQRLARFRAQNIASGFDDPRMRAFLERASAGDEDGSALDLHALRAGERIVAVYGGAAHGGHWSGMVNSFDADPEIAKCSPGDLLLMRVIAAQSTAGCKTFDLGIGEARYKATFCDEVIPLFDSFVAMNARGWMFATIQRASLRLKRAIKQNPRAFALWKRLRAMRLPGSGADQAT